jgi:hypothetical protein
VYASVAIEMLADIPNAYAVTKDSSFPKSTSTTNSRGLATMLEIPSAMTRILAFVNHYKHMRIARNPARENDAMAIRRMSGCVFTCW